MTTNKQVEYTLSYICVEAYMAGLDDGMPLHFTPGNKTQGTSPKITKMDGTVPDYIPTLNLKDSNSTVMAKLDAACTVFYALRKAREAK
jgi:hypothetical protein